MGKENAAVARPVFLTIQETVKLFHELDPNTAVTKCFLRELCVASAPFSMKVGQKYIINVNMLCAYLCGQASK